ncbi:Cystathionine beta-lyase/cystathionine gamma-synthase [Actinokineospora alba]|uniref:Cystathionine beta-lyase/cystathionine gamma-synthase n=1 Tax=Actinokineospora alba TaxID=504798 RepID=A0A1H0HC29_9PSEU|nr:PLP-dependent transferase [Actinokineospora alba]TDP64954.1 cystathionine beta-lyase/cystathionine gamma-synthase [Actinokineospora alba]SDH50206.1 Cystathionine beta-lyase/cystathionine gamma-synthase [Actinokineospora alba]SDO16441.1 Cystathionine beta-lyase/cystathionine gamma-synthase [Actinokineospora alba]
MVDETTRLLAATEFLDHESPTVRAFVDRALRGVGESPTEKAVALYYAVRDDILYEVYGANLSREGLQASSILDTGRGFCVHKSIVFVAACRAAGIPARLVMTDVRNHLASPRLRRLVGGDVFRFHALTSVYLEGKWVRATPVFNKLLCKVYGITPLEFDGTEDSVYHPYDKGGQRYMEFLHEYGEFDDFPFLLVTEGIRAAHPKLFASQFELTEGSLAAEAAAPAGVEPVRAELSPQAADLIEQFDRAARELRAARTELADHAAFCAENGLMLDPTVLDRLAADALHAEERVGVQRALVSSHPAVDSDVLTAGESVLRFALATIAYVRNAAEWSAQSYGQSKVVQFFDTRSQESPEMNYDRNGTHSAVLRVERQLQEVLEFPADEFGLLVASSGMAAFTAIEAFLIRDRLKPGDTVLQAPYTYYEATEQLDGLTFVNLVRSASYSVEDIIAEVVRHQPKVVFADPVANSARQRMVDIPQLLARLRDVVTHRTTVIVDGTMLAAALPADLLRSDDKLEIFYYESCTKYMQLGMDATLAGLIAFPIELRPRLDQLRRNTGTVLYRHNAELFPRYDRAFLKRRMERICTNAEDLATALHADPRVRDAGVVVYPKLPHHPDAEIAAALPYAGGVVTFLLHEDGRNNKPELHGVIELILANARRRGVQLTKGVSFGYAVPRLWVQDITDDDPWFVRIFAGDRGDQIDVLAAAIADGLAEAHARMSDSQGELAA